MPTSAHQHIHCGLKRGKTSQVWSEIMVGENECSLNLDWKSCLNGAGTTHHEHLSVCGVTHLGAHPPLMCSPGMEPGWPNWWILALIKGADLHPQRLLSTFLSCVWYLQLPLLLQGSWSEVSAKCLSGSGLQSCTFIDLRQPGISKLGWLEHKTSVLTRAWTSPLSPCRNPSPCLWGSSKRAAQCF